jgi:hypothetical protein
MSRLGLSALALASLAGAATAGDAPSESPTWLTLDRELEALAASLPAQDAAAPAGLQVGGWIKTSYDQSSDIAVAPSGNDQSGVNLESIRVNFNGKIGDYSVKISIEGKSGTFVLADGFARMPLAENVGLQMGQFKSRFVYSYYSSDNKMLFFRRNAIGSAWGTRDTGVQVDGRFGPFLGVLSLQNGDDSSGDEWALTGKAIWAPLGKMIESQVGGFGTDAKTALTLGLGYFDDSTVSNSSAISVEAIFVSGPFFATAEAVSHDDGFTGITSGVASKVDAAGFSDSTPWDATVAWMFTDQWEAALEYQDDDSSDDTTRIRGGLNYYVSGHDAKWQLNYTTASSDTASKEVDQLTLGLVVNV